MITPNKNGESDPGKCGDDLQYAIIRELMRCCENLGAKNDLMSVLASYRDTLTDEELFALLRTWNSYQKA